MDKVSPPQRPPPPKLSSLKGTFSQPELGAVSNLKTLSLDVGRSYSKKPKPTIRTRKKKFISADDVNQNSRQSEFVELSTSDVVIEYGNQEDEVRMVKQVEMRGQEQKLDTLTEDKEKEEDDSIETDRQEYVKEIDLEKDDWEVIPDSAADRGGVESGQVIMDEPCLQPNG